MLKNMWLIVEDFVAHLEMTWLLREMIELIVSFLRMAKNYVLIVIDGMAH